MDNIKYSDSTILKYYSSRWDIEVFFKLLKSNFKFQNLNEKDHINYKKLYICEIILTYVEKIIEYYFSKIYGKPKTQKEIDKKVIKKINKTNLLKGIFSSLLYDILYDKLTMDKLNIFCKSYVVYVVNKTGRSFVRNSKTPFTKWYIKGYSELTKYCKVIDAKINDTVEKLNKNLKVLAGKIQIIE